MHLLPFFYSAVALAEYQHGALLSDWLGDFGRHQTKVVLPLASYVASRLHIIEAQPCPLTTPTFLPSVLSTYLPLLSCILNGQY